MICWLEFFFIILLMMFSHNPLNLLFIFCFFLFCLLFWLGVFLNSFFYSYLVFLVFLSGVIIILMYVSSVVVSEKLKFSLSFGLMVLMIVLFCVVDSNTVLDLGSLQIYFSLTEFYNLFKFFVFSLSFFFLFFTLYLFFCLVLVYEILSKSKGPLRFKI